MSTIKSFKKFIEESIWSDMQDRSAGVTKRKEDDVNLLDYDGLYDYIKSKYSGKLYYIDKDHFGKGGETMYVDPIKNVSLYLKRLRDGSLEHILLSWVSVNINHPFLLKLEERFFVSSPNAMRRIIKEKDGTCTNQTYIDVIDFFLEHIDNIVVNESIWSDMQDRSAGDTVRQEDERHKILERLLATYIKLFAESCYYHDEYAYSSYPDFISYIKDFRDNPRIEEVCPNNSYFDDLLDYVNKETWDNQIFDTIVKISLKIVHGEHPITDDVIEELRKHNVNESIWSDMQDRSAGDTVRKEDEMNDYDFLMLRKTAEMFRNTMKRSRYASRRNTCDNFIKYIERRKEEHFWTNVSDEAYDKVIRFVQKNWGDCTDIQEFMDKYLSNINECDGVPGGLTPADVGGMGPAYFPGPNGEPGSGDLPSPTGIVYKQVAPFDTFIKIRKQKKKKKKFRKEDEPCAKYDNHPVCKHIDDFRDYVDRTYDNIDKKK